MPEIFIFAWEVLHQRTLSRIKLGIGSIQISKYLRLPLMERIIYDKFACNFGRKDNRKWTINWRHYAHNV